MNTVRVIKRSLRCFAFGCLGLVPILGIPIAIQAILLHKKIRKELQRLPFERRELGDVAVYSMLQGEDSNAWNPAHTQLRLGWTLAWCGLGISGLILVGCLWVGLRSLTS